MRNVIDRKFMIIAVNPCKKGTRFLVMAITCLQTLAKWFGLNACTEETGFYFKAADTYSVYALDGYISAMKIGAKGKVDDAQIASATLLNFRVTRYQREVGSRLPDIESDCESDRCIGGIGL